MLSAPHPALSPPVYPEVSSAPLEETSSTININSNRADFGLDIFY